MPKFYVCRKCGYLHAQGYQGECKSPEHRFVWYKLDERFGRFGWDETSAPVAELNAAKINKPSSVYSDDQKSQAPVSLPIDGDMLFLRFLIIFIFLFSIILLFAFGYVDLPFKTNEAVRQSNLQKLSAGERSNLCRLKTVCEKYSRKRYECATAGNYNLCMTIELKANDFEEGKIFCSDEGLIKGSEEGTPNYLECLFSK
jgi:hypothetical protein